MTFARVVRVLVLTGEGHRIGCVFDAMETGLAEACDPFVAADGAASVCKRLFGGPVDLHAGTHKADEARFGPDGSALNPGSPVLPADGSRPSFLRLKVTDKGCYGQMIWVA